MSEQFVIIKGFKFSTNLTELFITDRYLTNEDIKSLVHLKNLNIRLNILN